MSRDLHKFWRQEAIKTRHDMSGIIDTVFHDEHVEEINNPQEEYCDYDDECTSSVSDVNSSKGE